MIAATGGGRELAGALFSGRGALIAPAIRPPAPAVAAPAESFIMTAGDRRAKQIAASRGAPP
jgi:hypothetical protein